MILPPIEWLDTAKRQRWKMVGHRWYTNTAACGNALQAEDVDFYSQTLGEEIFYQQVMQFSTQKGDLDSS